MKSISKFLYRHCYVAIIQHENAQLGPRYTAYIRLDDHSDHLKRTPLRTITRGYRDDVEVDARKFIDDLPKSLSFAGPDMVDYYKKFISDRKQSVNCYQYKGYGVEVFLVASPKLDKYFLYQPCIELPNSGGMTITGGKYESLDEAELRAVELIESWN